ncbi:MAG TPA: DUF4112 domain-containing protein [Longimicrobiales bacterium]
MPGNEQKLASPHLTRLRVLTKVFDELIRVPGTNMKFGLDALIGLVPGGGDLVGGAVSAYAILVAAKLGASPAVVMRMGLNILIDTIVGAVPFLGDLFDAGWKANRKNVDLLERHIAAPAAARRSSMAVVISVIAVLLIAIVGVAVGTVWLLSRLF